MSHQSQHQFTIIQVLGKLKVLILEITETQKHRRSSMLVDLTATSVNIQSVNGVVTPEIGMKCLSGLNFFLLHSSSFSLTPCIYSQA